MSITKSRSRCSQYAWRTKVTHRVYSVKLLGLMRSREQDDAFHSPGRCNIYLHGDKVRVVRPTDTVNKERKECGSKSRKQVNEYG